MTNPRCTVCRGWGYVPDVTPMKICDEPYPSGKRKGEPCTPRTVQRTFGPPAGTKAAPDKPGVTLPSERRQALRNA